MMVKLQQLDRALSFSQPLLLPLPTNPAYHSSPLTPSSLRSSPIMPAVRLSKIEVSFFSGDDVLGWLFSINHYFLFFFMAGAAHQWFQWLHSFDQLHHWEDFVWKLELCFCPSSFVNHEANLFKLKQTTTITAFLYEFECLSTRVIRLSEQSLLNCFLFGLKDEI